MRSIFSFFTILLFLSCKPEVKKNSEHLPESNAVPVEYAQGFKIQQYKDFKILKVQDPWPDADREFTYLLLEKGATPPKELEYDEKITIPVEKLVVTSTTHIPSLELLNEQGSLVGFPGLDYISSEKTRKLINSGKIKELGKNEAINTEIMISLDPEVVVGFAVNGSNKSFNTIQKSGIPVVFNGDWTEESPLGKAEWIKFFGALFNKSGQAKEIFKEIETSYEQSVALAKNAANMPKVLSGSMYKDQWYVPFGNSWSAQFIKDANAIYIYNHTIGSGSNSLNFEKVLSDAQNVEFWIAPGQFQSYEQLLESSPHYAQFEAVKNKKVFTYNNTLGETGGTIYYELAPTRPDLVLKDMISIFHPELLPDYKPVFFKPLD